MTKCKKFDHIIHIDDFGNRRCARCGCFFDRTALIKSMKYRFGKRYREELLNLREWKTRMNKKIKDREKPEFFIIVRYKGIPD